MDQPTRDPAPAPQLQPDPQPTPPKAKDEKVGGCVLWGASIFFVLLGLVVLIAGGIAPGLLLAVLGAGLIPALPFSIKTRAILCGGAVAAMLVFAGVQAVTDHSKPPQTPVSQAQPPVAEKAAQKQEPPPAVSKGLGISSDAFKEHFRDFKLEPQVLPDGRKALVGVKTQELATLNLIGDPTNIEETNLSVSLPLGAEQRQIVKLNQARLILLLKTAVPEWGEGSFDWYKTVSNKASKAIKGGESDFNESITKFGRLIKYEIHAGKVEGMPMQVSLMVKAADE